MNEAVLLTYESTENGEEAMGLRSLSHIDNPDALVAEVIAILEEA